ncbi:MAG: PAS domain S-box protein, partial [Coriobacteriales bacterium]|nr:PAS domain S-box protein [Coriobacteriales bacterium]
MNHRDGGTDAEVEEVLLAREEQFRMLAENLPDQVTRFDTSGRIQYVSPSVVRAYGIAPSEVIGKTIMEVATPGGPAGDRRYLDAVLRAVAESEPNTLEAKWMTKDGERVVEVRHIPEKDASGRVVSVLGIARDITESKRAEQELREREEQYRRIVDTAYEGIWVLDAEAKATFVNARVTEMLGYESEDLIGRPLADFVVAEERADHETRMRNRRQGKSEYYE